MYSVLPTTVTPLPCQNITTTPGLKLSSATTALGALTQYSYIDQVCWLPSRSCMDLNVCFVVHYRGCYSSGGSTPIHPDSAFPFWPLRIFPSQFHQQIAAPNRTPFNITANSREEIAWKVALVSDVPWTEADGRLTIFQPFGTRFFLSVSSSDGLSSAYGPLTVGGLGPGDCFGSDEMYVVVGLFGICPDPLTGPLKR